MARSMFRPRRRVSWPAVGLSVLAVALVAGGAAFVRLDAAPRGRPQEGAARAVTVAPPAVSLPGTVAGRLPAGAPLTVQVSAGEILSVDAVPAGGSPLAGTVNAGGSSWVSGTGVAPGSKYRLHVLYADLAHTLHGKSFTVTTGPAAHVFTALLSPGDGDVVGIGQPVVIYFDRTLTSFEQAQIQRHLAVTTQPAVAGAWHWISPTEVHWHPRRFWASGTVVHVVSDLTDVELADGSWGNGRHTVTFRIGAAHVSVADINQHVFRVYSDGKLIRVLKMSAGRDKYPTDDGVHIALEKNPVVRMDSATVGIPVNSPDGYNELVYWDVRISYSGEFVHAAPWSVAEQGVANVSHGCINLSPAGAQWFYGFTQRGDVVSVVDGGAPTNVSDPGMVDWNLSWAQWTA